MKQLQGQLDFLETQESYVKDETKNLRRELLRAKEEVTRIQVLQRTPFAFSAPSTASKPSSRS